jgi:hypothetical protein
MTFENIRKRLKAATPGLKEVERLDGHCEESFRYEIQDDEHLVAFYEDNHRKPMRAKFNAELYAHATEDIKTLLKAVDVLTEALESISKNGCCETCQEARLVALRALANLEKLSNPTCKDCGVPTQPGAGSARCQGCWDDRCGYGE